jgi:hypothetical protein
MLFIFMRMLFLTSIRRRLAGLSESGQTHCSQRVWANFTVWQLLGRLALSVFGIMASV